MQITRARGALTWRGSRAGPEPASGWFPLPIHERRSTADAAAAPGRVAGRTRLRGAAAVLARSSARPEQCAPGAVRARSGARPKQSSHRAVLARKRQWQCVPAPCELERLPRGAAAGHLGAEGGECWLVACGLAPCEVAQRMEYIPCGDEGAGRPRGGRALLLRSIACGDSDGAPDELSSCPPQAVVHMHVRWPVCTGDEEKLTLVRLDDCGALSRARCFYTTHETA